MAWMAAKEGQWKRELPHVQRACPLPQVMRAALAA